MSDQPAVLLIDDDPGFVYLIQRYAGTSGCRFLTTTSARAALDLAQRERPVLIILDLLLAPCDRWHVLRQLKTDAQTHAIPLAICATLLDHDYRWGDDADFCLSKPVMYDDFLTMLGHLGVSVGK